MSLDEPAATGLPRSRRRRRHQPKGPHSSLPRANVAYTAGPHSLDTHHAPPGARRLSMNRIARQSQSAPALLRSGSTSRRALSALLATSALALGLALSPAAQADGGRHHGPQGMAQGMGGHGMGGHGMGGHGMGPAMGMMGHPRMAERVLDRINATPEQRTQVRALLKGVQDESRADREAGRALAQQAAELFAQPTVDANAAEALRQQMLARADAASRRMTQLMLELSRVLTPEQRAQLAAERQQMREKMERRRAERGERASPR